MPEQRAVELINIFVAASTDLGGIANIAIGTYKQRLRKIEEVCL